MPELDTQIPAWLQRNWTPKEPFDPTPWLQERYRRQVEQQVMPLKIQQLQLQNQTAQLQIAHQSMVNDQQAIDQAAFIEDQEVLKSALDEAAKHPDGSLGVKTPSFRSRAANELWRQHQIADSQNTAARIFQEDEINKWRLANKLSNEGVDVIPAIIERDNPSMPHGLDREMLGKLAKQRLQDQESQRLKEIAARSAWHTSAGTGASPAQRRVLELQAASDAVDAAYETGDPDEIFRAERLLRWTTEAQLREHPNDLKRAEIAAWKAELADVNKKLGDITLKNQWPALETRKTELRSQMKEWTGAMDNVTTSTQPEGKGTNAFNVGRFKVTPR